MIPPGSRVLDLGCGSGEIASHLAARGDTVWGVDVNAAALAQAAAHFADTRVADLEEAELVDLFPGLRFDVVLFADVLEHVREPWSLLQAARAVLAPGGAVVASIPNFSHAAVRLAVVSGTMPYRGLGILDDTHVRFFTLNGVASLFEESGFRLQDVQRTRLPFDEPSDLVPDVRLLRVPADIERHVREDPESETLQFVVRAVMLPGEWDMEALRGRLHDVEARAEEQAVGLRNFRREHAAAAALADERAARIAALEGAMETAVAPFRAEVLALTAAHDDLAARLRAATADADARGRELDLAAARQAELEREASATFAASAAMKRERDDALAAQAREEEARRAADAEVRRARAAMREAIEQRDDARSVLAAERTRQKASESALQHRLDGARREFVELRGMLDGAREAGRDASEALAAAQEEARAATAERARVEAAAAEERERLNAAIADAEQRVANMGDAAAKVAALEMERAGLANALAHGKEALLEALQERDAMAAQLARGAEANAARAADAAELALFRERARRDALVRLARDHAALGEHDDGAQVWRAGAAT